MMMMMMMMIKIMPIFFGQYFLSISELVFHSETFRGKKAKEKGEEEGGGGGERRCQVYTVKNKLKKNALFNLTGTRKKQGGQCHQGSTKTKKSVCFVNKKVRLRENSH